MLLPYYPIKSERSDLIVELIKQFAGKLEIKHKITHEITLILKKDERGLNGSKRYFNSPFPLLTNVEWFSCSLGEWNKDLGSYGLKVRLKRNDPKEEGIPGTQIYLLNQESTNSKGNRYLRRKYRKLEYYRNEGQIRSYWLLSWYLLQHSWTFKLACLNSWKSLWYEEYDMKDLQSIWKTINEIVDIKETKTNIYNVWIESPKNKYRQLGVPKKAWRLYLHCLNMFLSYIYSPFLPSSQYDGFIYNRGCKSWWEKLIWSPTLTTYHSILEVDFSSGFP